MGLEAGDNFFRGSFNDYVGVNAAALANIADPAERTGVAVHLYTWELVQASRQDARANGMTLDELHRSQNPNLPRALGAVGTKTETFDLPNPLAMGLQVPPDPWSPGQLQDA